MNLRCEEIACATLDSPAQRRGAELLYHCPRHDDQHPSLSVNPRKNAWLCGPCGRGGNAWELAAFLAGCGPSDKNRVRAWLRERGLMDGKNAWKVRATYPYLDESGKLLFETVKYEPKQFKQRRPNGKGGWVWNLDGVRLVPYRLPEWKDWDIVFIAEGEKDVDNLWDWSIPATCNPLGAGKWRPEYNQHFAGKQVIILPDHDPPGEAHAHYVVRHLFPVVKAVKILRLPGLPPKGDVSDWIACAGTKDRLMELVKATPALTAADVAAWGPAGHGNDAPPGVLLSEVKPERVAWLWPGYIPLGKIAVLDGDPGLGKSLLTLEIAARLTTDRPLPGDAEGMSGGVVILSAEDGLADTIRPRLEAAGADLNRIVAMRYTPEREGERTVSNIVVDIPTIMEAIERVGARLVIVDVLVAYLPSDTNSYRDQDVRLALAPLAEMASSKGVAVICVRHLTKGPVGNPIYRGGGSIGIIGAARAGLLVARDPDDSNLIVLAQSKSNLGPPMPSLAYRIEPNSERVPCIVWKGESGQTAVSLLAAAVGDEEERGALAEAREFLHQELADGRQPQKELKAAARKAGIADVTLRRAKAMLGVKSRKDGFASEWYWELPNMRNSAEDAHIHGMSTFGKNEVSNTHLTSEKSSTSPKMLKDAHCEDAQQGMSTFGKTGKMPLEEGPPEWEEGTL